MPRDGDLLGLSLRERPASPQAEQMLLGAILGNNRAYERVAAFLRPEHFADPIHGRIYEEAARRIETGKLADAVTLKAVFEGTRTLDEIGGTAYLAKLLSSMAPVPAAADYGHAIREAWVRRALIELGEDIINDAFIPPNGNGGEALVSDAMARLLDLGDASASATLGNMDEAINRALEGSEAAASGKRRVLLSGIASLDRMWRGLWPGALDILGARAETGKTALGMQITTGVARQLLAEGNGEHVLFFSLEMSREELGIRALASETGIPADDIRSGTLTVPQAGAMVQARKSLFGLPIMIDDRAGLSLSQIMLQGRAQVRRKKVRLIVIDHLHRIRAAGNLSRLDQVADCTLRLKDMARSLDVPVLLLAQLSRASDKREDHRPTKADLMYAGEADADNILLLYRPELHLPQSPPTRSAQDTEARHMEAVNRYHDDRENLLGVAEAIFAKRRAGPIGMVKLRFNGPRTRFEDWV